MNRRMEYEDREINLLHLLCYMLEKYKSLIVVLVVGAVLGLGIGIIKKPEPVVQEEIEDTIEEEEYEPTEEMKEKMEIAYQFRRLYEQQKEYNDNSIIMQLDSNKMYVGRVTYYLSTIGDEGELSAAYSAIIEEEAFLKKLAKVADTESGYIREVIGASYARSSFNQETDVAAGVITYSVTHYDKDVCRKVLDNLMEQVEKYHQKHRDKYGEYEFRKVVDVLTTRINSSYVDSQNGHTSKLNSFYSTVVSQESKFVDDDLEYYQIHYLGEKDVADDEETIVQSEAEQTKVNNAVKYFVIGIAMAGFFWAMFWGVQYLFDNRIHIKEEVERRYGIPVVGYVRDDRKKQNRYSKLKKYIYDSEEYLKYVLSSLSEDGIVVCNYKGIEISGDKVYCYADYLWKNSQTMEKAKEIGNVVIGVDLGKSTYDEVEREIEMCMVQNVNISGMIVME